MNTWAWKNCWNLSRCSLIWVAWSSVITYRKGDEWQTCCWCCCCYCCCCWCNCCCWSPNDKPRPVETTLGWWVLLWSWERSINYKENIIGLIGADDDTPIVAATSLPLFLGLLQLVPTVIYQNPNLKVE